MFLWGKAISDGKPYYCRKGKKSSDLFYGKNDISICRTETMVQRASGFIISGHVCREKREHIQDYQTYFNASRLTFRQEMNLDNLTTPERLKESGKDIMISGW